MALFHLKHLVFKKSGWVRGCPEMGVKFLECLASSCAKKTPGVCILFIFLYELDLIDESIRTSKNYKFFFLSGLGGIPDDY